MTIKPLTQRLFGKENIRQIVREWLEQRKKVDVGDNRRFSTEIIEHNIEWFEALYMKALTNFVTDTISFYITKVCYNNILYKKEDGLTEEYIKYLQVKVKDIFLGEINEKEHKLNYKFENYLCTKTIEELFYQGEVYKHFKFYSCDGKIKGVYGYERNLGGKWVENSLSLVPQEGDKHLIISEEWFCNFEKVDI